MQSLSFVFSRFPLPLPCENFLQSSMDGYMSGRHTRACRRRLRHYYLGLLFKPVFHELSTEPRVSHSIHVPGDAPTFGFTKGVPYPCNTPKKDTNVQVTTSTLHVRKSRYSELELPSLSHRHPAGLRPRLPDPPGHL